MFLLTRRDFHLFLYLLCLCLLFLFQRPSSWFAIIIVASLQLYSLFLYQASSFSLALLSVIFL